jgi:hypothetical protein
MRRLHRMTLLMPEMDSTGQIAPTRVGLTSSGPRSFLLANYCAMYVRASKTRHFEKFKINISTRRMQTTFCTRKRLNTRSISLGLTCR